MKTKKLKIFAAAKGFWGRRKNCWAIATRAVHRAWASAYEGRKVRARHMRTSWIQAINAAARQHGATYSGMVKTLPELGVHLNRKVLAQLAVTEPHSFHALTRALAWKTAREAPLQASAAQVLQ